MKKEHFFKKQKWYFSWSQMGKINFEDEAD